MRAKLQILQVLHANVSLVTPPAPSPPQALQFLDVITMKDPSQKAQFFRTTLTDVFPFIPRASMECIEQKCTSSSHINHVSPSMLGITGVDKDVPICCTPSH